ncbi:MAG TPA: efflux RND transporter periplasmic adaptor subunit [Rhizomicrobium sp.]|jgi:multidrug efflux system membrane fusion protein|nr:efflux RND transporter periplasmic adaptor subunit [Rhizomicrobium sp.]
MSHIADLTRTDRFEAGARPVGAARILKNRALLGAAAAVLLGGLGLIAWHAEAGSKPAPAAPPAVTVGVTVVHARPVRIWSEFSGRMTAVDSADIRPEVNGRITEIRFRNGQSVKAGDILFVIDPRPYEAAVAKAEADLATARSNASFAHTDLARAKALIGAQAISRVYYDQRVNAEGVADAAIKSAEAELASANVDLDHAYVKAPIDGRVSRAELTVGNVVQSGANAPLLTSIVSNDGIYADFDVDEQTYLATVRAHAATAAKETNIPVELTIPGDTGHAYEGAIESFDNKINIDTGTIRARARFANADGTLVPGMFVSVRLASARDSNAILVPEAAIGSDQSKRFVFVVDRGDHADYRAVTLGKEAGGEQVVTAGLHDGERIIISGLQKVQPGALVDPVPGARELASR